MSVNVAIDDQGEESLFKQAAFEDYEAQGGYLNYQKIRRDVRRAEDRRSRVQLENVFVDLRKDIERVYIWYKDRIDTLVDVGIKLRERTLKAKQDFMQFKKEFEDAGEDSQLLSREGLGQKFIALSEALGFSLTRPKDDDTSATLNSKRDAAKYQDFDNHPIADAARTLIFETFRIVEARNLNHDVVEWILQRFAPNKATNTSLIANPLWEQLMDGCDFMEITTDPIFYALSIVFECIREIKLARSKMLDGIKDDKKKDTQIDESQDFIRTSVKYVVHQQDLPFIIGRIIQHLPLSTFRDTFDDMVVNGTPETRDAYRLGSYTTSIYYENPDFLLYHRRLERLEGASLVRFRWYGDGKGGENDKHDINPDLSPDAEIFVEMKVHHEAWSGEASTKRRFNLKSKEINDYLSGQLSLRDKVENMAKAGKPLKIIRKYQELATTILSKVEAYNLLPALKTKYCRSAYQRGLDQSIRVSIDTELQMIAEDFGASKHWRFCGRRAPMPTDNFPYAVVEVKLQLGETQRLPPWVEELMECRYMEYVPKFSKFSHGIASLYGNSGKLHLEPYWMNQIGVDIRSATKVDNRFLDLRQGLTKNLFDHTMDEVLLPDYRSRSIMLRGIQTYAWMPSPSKQRFKQAQIMWNSAYAKKAGKDEGSISIVDMDLCARLASRVFNARNRIYTQYLKFDTESWNRPRAKTEVSGIPWQTMKRINVPHRFDPKTFTTAERQFLRWVGYAIKIYAAGILMFHYAQGGVLPVSSSGHNDSRGYFFDLRGQLYTVLGVVMMVSAFCVLMYSLALYRARSLRLYAKQKMRSDSPHGPQLITWFLASTLMVVGGASLLVRYAEVVMNWVS